jgi:hypothetical protein
LSDYKAIYKEALAASIHSGSTQYTRAQSTAINDVEKVLRHFHACYHVRRLGVDAGALDRTYSYYLKMCVSDQRFDLRDYINTFGRTSSSGPSVSANRGRSACTYTQSRSGPAPASGAEVSTLRSAMFAALGGQRDRSAAAAESRRCPA